MDTNLVANHDLIIYETQFTDFGDREAVGEGTVIKALLEDTRQYGDDAYTGDQLGDIVCQIFPDTPYYVAKAGRLTGQVAQFNRYGMPATNDWFKVVSVRPGESLFDGTPDLVEITLTKIAARDVADEES